MRAGSIIARARPMNRLRDVFGSALIELYDSNWGIGLSADGLYVESWTGMIRSLALTPMQASYRPKYEADGSYWGGRKIVSCYKSSMSGLYSGIMGTKIAVPNNRDVCIMAICRVRTAVPYDAVDFANDIPGVAGAVSDQAWSGYWPGNSSVSLVYGWNGSTNHGYMGKYRVTSPDRANTAQWWPPSSNNTSLISTPQVATSAWSADAGLTYVGPTTHNWPNGREYWGRGQWQNELYANWQFGQIARLWIGNISHGTDFTDATAPVPAVSSSLDISFRMVAFLNRLPTSAEFSRLRADCGYGEGCQLPTSANQI